MKYALALILALTIPGAVQAQCPANGTCPNNGQGINAFNAAPVQQVQLAPQVVNLAQPQVFAVPLAISQPTYALNIVQAQPQPVYTTQVVQVQPPVVHHNVGVVANHNFGLGLGNHKTVNKTRTRTVTKSR